MADKTTLCNMALSSLKVSERITSIASGSTVAEACALHWDAVVDEVLAAYPWNFATAYQKCELKAETPLVKYDYAHGLKNNALRVLSVYGSDGEEMKEQGEWKRQGRNILCNEDDTLFVEVIYRENDPTLWTPSFVGAFVARLASAIGPEIGKSKDAVTQYQLFLSKISTAKTLDATESAPPEIEPSEWETAHLY